MKGTYIPGFDPFLVVIAFAFLAVVFKRREDVLDRVGRNLKE
jgi:hypothetical protein